MKEAKVLKSVILVSIATVQMFFAASQATAQSNGFAVTPIVKRGDAVSDGGRFFDCNSCEGRVIGLHALNNRGDVAIGADVVGGRCSTNRFLVSGGQSIRLVDFCHETEFGDLTFLGSVNINDQGQAAINTGVTVNNRIVEMLLLYSEGRLSQIVKEGDTTPDDTIIKGCGFGQPDINDNGEIAFHACAETREGFFKDGIFVYSNGAMRKVAAHGDPSPVGQGFVINFFPGQPVQINNRGDVLFRASILIDIMTQKYGLFLSTDEGIKKIELDGESLPGGLQIKRESLGIGDLNNKGDVAFAIGLDGESDGGIFLSSSDSISKIVIAGDSSPIGGRFSRFDQGASVPFPLPHINDKSAVAFKAFVTGGSASSAIFLASPQAIIKVAAIGDELPTGGKIKSITSFALNDFGQVAFYAEVKNGPKGVFLATPLAPSIEKIKLKRKQGRLELRVNGEAMITSDTVIEINGAALDALSYPEDFRENGGTTRRTVSRDGRLDELIPVGQSVQITLFNRLTRLRSAPVSFMR